MWVNNPKKTFLSLKLIIEINKDQNRISYRFANLAKRVMANFHFSWYCDLTTYQHGHVKEFWTDEDSISKELEQLKKWQNEEVQKISDLIASSKFINELHKFILNEPVVVSYLFWILVCFYSSFEAARERKNLVKK